MDNEILSSVNAEPEVNVEPHIDSEQVETTNEPVNAGSGEVTPPIVEDKPVQTAEENSKYAQIRREAETKARDKTIADMGMEWNGQPITTYDQYVKAKAESEQNEREQAIREEYEAKGLPDELIEELVESKRDREERKAEKATRAEEAKKQAEYADFFEYFKQENERDFNSATDTITQDVWDLVAKGKTLTDAYTYNVNKQLKAKIAEYESKLKAQETNQVNAGSSTGSVTGNGSAGPDHISFESFEANKGDQGWVKKNLTKIMESRAKW